jgi:putative acetyltransferase
MRLTIAEESPLGADLADLHARHTAAMHFDTPPDSIHMMDAGALAVPGIRFFVMRQDGRPVGMGAFKRLSDPAHAEIKSMHVLSELRGQGLAKAMVDHLVAQARADGVRRLSLETGAQESFRAAQMLYERLGFTPCPPFEGYGPDPWSLFLTREI